MATGETREKPAREFALVGGRSVSGVVLVGSRSLVGPKNSRIEAVVEYHLSSPPPACAGTSALVDLQAHAQLIDWVARARARSFSSFSLYLLLVLSSSLLFSLHRTPLHASTLVLRSSLPPRWYSRGSALPRGCPPSQPPPPPPPFSPHPPTLVRAVRDLRPTAVLDTAILWPLCLRSLRVFPPPLRASSTHPVACVEHTPSPPCDSVARATAHPPSVDIPRYRGYNDARIRG